MCQELPEDCPASSWHRYLLPPRLLTWVQARSPRVHDQIPRILLVVRGCHTWEILHPDHSYAIQTDDSMTSEAATNWGLGVRSPGPPLQHEQEEEPLKRS